MESSRQGSSMERLRQRTSEIGDTVIRRGRVTSIVGTVVRCRVPEVRIGQRCIIRRDDQAELAAEVVGFDEQGVLMMPLGRVDHICVNAEVIPGDTMPTVPCGTAVRGRVLDGLGQPVDDHGPLATQERVSLIQAPPSPLSRRRISEPLATGIRCIDSLLTIGVGQRVAIFAPASGGKSTLLSMLARFVEADAVVLALIGERGREVAPFIEDNLGPDGLAKATVVVSTSDQPALVRLKAAYCATAIAEDLRRRGQRVVLMMDSITRFARALREVALAAGELPARRAYPPSVFAELPQLYERAGNDAHGSITAFYTVLVEGELDDDPIAEETKSLVDGHIVLSRELGEQGHWPAIDLKRSKSRLMHEIVPSSHERAARWATSVYGTYVANRNKIELGVYEHGSNADIDASIRHYPDVKRFLQQDWRTKTEFRDSIAQLEALSAKP